MCSLACTVVCVQCGYQFIQLLADQLESVIVLVFNIGVFYSRLRW